MDRVKNIEVRVTIEEEGRWTHFNIEINFENMHRKSNVGSCLFNVLTTLFWALNVILYPGGPKTYYFLTENMDKIDLSLSNVKFWSCCEALNIWNVIFLFKMIQFPSCWWSYNVAKRFWSLWHNIITLRNRRVSFTEIDMKIVHRPFSNTSAARIAYFQTIKKKHSANKRKKEWYHWWMCPQILNRQVNSSSIRM